MAERVVNVRLIAQTQQYQAAMAKATATTRGLGVSAAQAGQATSTSMSKAGTAMQGVGMTSKMMLGGVVAGGLLAAAKASIDFESSFAGIKKTVDGSQSQFAALAQGMRDLSTEIPINVNELNRIGEAAGQLGIATPNILGFTETMAKLGVTTNLSSEQAATSLARLANITQMPQAEFDRLGSTIVALGNKGASTEAEITEMGLRIAGAGHQVGMTKPQILALGTALSDVGMEAEAGGSAISKIMIEMATQVETGGDKLATFASVAGMSAQQFSKAFRTDAAGAIGTFISGLGKVDKQGGSTIAVLQELGITEVRMRDALMRTAGAGDSVNKFLAIGNAAWAENNALTAEAAQRFETTASKIELAKNNLGDLAITLGDAVKWLGEPLIEGAGNLAGTANDVIGGLEDFVRTGLDFSGDYAFEKQQAGLETYAATLAGTKDPLYAMGVAQGEAAKAAEDHSGALKDQVTALQRLASASGFLSIQGEALGAVSARRDAIDAQRELNRLQVAGKRGTREYRDAVLANKEAQLRAVEAQVSLAESVNGYVEKVRDGELSEKHAIARIKEYGAMAGLTKEEIATLIGEVKGLVSKYEDVPPSVKTKVEATGLSEAISKASTLAYRLSAIPRNVHTTITTSGAIAAARPAGAPTGPARASGGPVRAGETYKVGERGVEYLTMGKSAGYVTPNHRLGSGPSTMSISGTLEIPGLGKAILDKAEIVMENREQDHASHSRWRPEMAS